MNGKEAYRLKQDQFIYAVTRIHNHEQNLLTRQDIEQLLSAAGTQEAFRLLAEKGWGSPTLPPNDADALLEYESEKTWGLISELTDDLDAFYVLRSAIDYHNLKAAIKLVYSGEDETAELAGYFRSHGTVPVEVLMKAARQHDFSELPSAMAQAGKEAYELLLHTASGQACDMAIDTAALVAMQEAANASESELLMLYARLTADMANIKAAVRSARMKRERSFLERAIAPAGSLDRAALIEAAQQGEQAIYDILAGTDYAGAAQAARSSISAFELWCDNLLMEKVRPQKYQYSGIDPLAAFVIGRENEIAMVRLVLSVKINKLSDAVARERLRDMYV